MDISQLVDFSKLKTNNSLYTASYYDPGVVGEGSYYNAKLMLASVAKDEVFFDLGCGIMARYMQQAVEELGGIYVGVDIHDLSTYFQGEFLQSDFFAFFDALKNQQSVNYIINNIDHLILNSDTSAQKFLDGVLKTTKKIVYCGHDSVVKKPLYYNDEFTSQSLMDAVTGNLHPPANVDTYLASATLFIRK